MTTSKTPAPKISEAVRARLYTLMAHARGHARWMRPKGYGSDFPCFTADAYDRGADNVAAAFLNALDIECKTPETKP